MPYPIDDDDDFGIFPAFVDFDDSDQSEPDSPQPYNDDDSKSSSPPTDSSEEDEPTVVANRRRTARPHMTLQQRRLSKLGYNIGFQLDGLSELQRVHSEAISIQNNNLQKKNNQQIAESPISPESEFMSPAKKRWRKALKLISRLKDPWAKFHLENYKEETVMRHRYNPLLKKWVKDSITVKMEKEPFNHGAMRSCYRLRKTGNHHHKASINFVAKIYMEDVERDVYFEDVRLQMDAKLWGEEYNRHHPPKQVDIFQMSIIEFINRDEKPLYHLEHFIEGDYIKYNSNSGFVDENLRLTPQAFSHFTFERSGHKLIIVDVQGVGDLWTDPQIHTDDGLDYGSGNLGTRGFALFFHSHVCNSICRSLRLSLFDLSSKESSTLTKFIQLQKNAGTVLKHAVEPVCSPSPTEKVDLTNLLARSRSNTMSRASTLSRTSSTYSDEDEDELPDLPNTRRQRSSDMIIGSPVISTEELRNLRAGFRAPRTRYISESDGTDNDSMTEEEERQRFQQMANQTHRPSCISHEIQVRKESILPPAMNDSVLGQIHHDLAKYHELGRFAENDNEIDWDAALFHEKLAAELGVMEAILTMAKLNLGMQPEVLVNCTVTPTADSVEDGIKYMLMAANAGDRGSMLYMASAFETGTNLGKFRAKSYAEAVHWYEKAYQAHEDESGDYDGTMCTPQHILRSKMAEMYLEGGFELDKDPSYAGELYNEAAEDAMAAMKGKMANKYYALAEEAYAQVEED